MTAYQELKTEKPNTPSFMNEEVKPPHTNGINIMLALLLLVLAGFLILYIPSRENTRPPQYIVPPSEPTLSPTQAITQVPSEIPIISSSTPIQSVAIPLVSIDGWKQVSNGGVIFMIPPDARCEESETQCSRVQYPWEVQGRTVTSTLYIDVRSYNGGSRRAQFLETNQEILNCNPLYVESTFGQVSALQIAIDGGMCQGGGGGIITVVGDKLVSFRDLSYDSDTNMIPRFAVRDTIISTVR